MRNEHTGLISAYFEAAAVITTLVLLGQVLELRARSQTSSTIKELLGLAPVSYTHLRAHETVLDLVCRLLLEKKNNYNIIDKHVDDTRLTSQDQNIRP